MNWWGIIIALIVTLLTWWIAWELIVYVHNEILHNGVIS